MHEEKNPALFGRLLETTTYSKNESSNFDCLYILGFNIYDLLRIESQLSQFGYGSIRVCIFRLKFQSKPAWIIPIRIFVFSFVFISGVLEIPSYLMMPPLIKYIGRRPVFSGFLLICGVALLSSLLFHEGTNFKSPKEFKILKWFEQFMA